LATIVPLPASNSMAELLDFSHRLSALPLDQRYEFDFADVNFVTPAWMVLVGNALRDFKKNRQSARRRAIRYKHLLYAAHAGFFRYLGLEFGAGVGEANSSENFIPITERRVEDIRRAASSRYAYPGDIIQEEADKLSSVLTQATSGALYDTLAYSIRELVRNVLEHSHSPTYTFAAQYWPARGVAEVVVSDEGIGLADSLRSRFEIADDAEAVTLAVRPGVSSQATSASAYDHWGNSGYGLFMTKELCSGGGGYFALASGASSATWRGESRSEIDCSVSGTTVAMSLNTSNLPELTGRLRDLAAKADGGSKLPSGASLSARR